MIKRFLASPLSGYILIALLVACAGAGYWFWSELKEFGSLSERAEFQQREIKSLENRAVYLQGVADAKHEIGIALSQSEAKVNRRYESMILDIRKELKNASKEYLDCRAMPVPELLRYPDSDRNSGYKARTKDDG